MFSQDECNDINQMDGSDYSQITILTINVKRLKTAFKESESQQSLRPRLSTNLHHLQDNSLPQD